MERFSARLTATMRKLGDSRAEMVAATRFFRNPKVTAHEILQTAAAGPHVSRVFTHHDLPVLHALVKSLEGKTQKQKIPTPPKASLGPSGS